MTTTYSTSYKTAMRDAQNVLEPTPNRWGPATADELQAIKDAAAAIDGAGCDMPEGGLSAAAELAIELADWLK